MRRFFLSSVWAGPLAVVLLGCASPRETPEGVVDAAPASSSGGDAAGSGGSSGVAGTGGASGVGGAGGSTVSPGAGGSNAVSGSGGAGGSALIPGWAGRDGGNQGGSAGAGGAGGAIGLDGGPTPPPDGSATAPVSLSLFVGVWHLTSGVTNWVCDGEKEFDDLTGELTVKRGLAAPLVMDFNGCVSVMDVSGASANYQPGQTCRIVDEDVLLTLNWDPKSGMALTSPGSAVLYLEASGPLTSGGTSLHCTMTASGVLKAGPAPVTPDAGPPPPPADARYL